MGTIRFVLALSVMLHHGIYGGPRFGDAVGPLRLVSADMAVLFFFIISGFYIAMALERNYLGTPRGTLRFYINRVVRLYPTYLFIMVLSTVLVWAFKDFFIYTGSQLKVLPPALLTYQDNRWWAAFGDFSNLFIFGLENLHLYRYGRMIVNPPAWSLAVELTFYLLAPFILIFARSIPILIVAVLVGTAAVIYRWLPIVLAHTFFFYSSFFLLGVLSWRLSEIVRKAGYQTLMMQAGLMMFGAVCIWIVGSVLWLGYLPPFYEPHSHADHEAKIAAYSLSAVWWYVGLAVVMPAIFYATRKNAVDRFLGDLCYPIYILHWPFYFYIAPLLQFYYGPSSRLFDLDYSGFVCLAFSVLVYFLIEFPLQSVRREVRGADIGTASSWRAAGCLLSRNMAITAATGAIAAIALDLGAGVVVKQTQAATSREIAATEGHKEYDVVASPSDVEAPGGQPATRLVDGSPSRVGSIYWDVPVSDDDRGHTVSIDLKAESSPRIQLVVAYLGGRQNIKSSHIDTRSMVPKGDVLARRYNLGDGWYRFAINIRNNLSGNTLFRFKVVPRADGAKKSGSVYIANVRFEP